MNAPKQPARKLDLSKTTLVSLKLRSGIRAGAPNASRNCMTLGQACPTANCNVTKY